MTLPPLPELRTAAQAAHIALTCISTHPTLDMSDYLRGRVDAAAAGLEAALAAVPAQPVLDCEIQPRPLAYPLTDYHSAGIDGPLNYTWKDKPHRLLYDLIAAVRYYAAPQAVPVPAGWSVTYDGKRASYIYADQETAEFEAQQVGGTARAVAVYLAAAPKEQPHE